ncbi:MAG: hypothetical protein HUU15_17905 [Candidatus Brocadiae bacterium]|nr:hypothetical protein [Candidatus Brocadiia bacterium]
MTKTVLPALALSILSALTATAGPSQEELIKKRDKKLGEAWVTKQPWFTDYAKAKAEAAKSGKIIFTYFSRSYSP